MGSIRNSFCCLWLNLLDKLDCRGSRANDGHSFPRQVIVVPPPGRVKYCPLETFNAGDGRQRWLAERSIAKHRDVSSESTLSGRNVPALVKFDSLLTSLCLAMDRSAS